MVLQKAQRSSNIELLRILAMFFILFGHVMGKMVTTETVDSLDKVILTIFSSIGSGAVDCFILITGYFLINKREIRIQRFIKILFQTIFYSAGITLIFFAFNKASFYDFCSSLYPLASSKFNYWFVSQYLALILLQPFLSRFALTLNKKSYTIFLIFLIIINTELFSIFPWGYMYSSSWKITWFICLFFTGGYIRLFVSEDKLKNNRQPLLLFILIMIIILFFTSYYNWNFIKLGYNSLLTYSYSIGIFLLFRSLKIDKCTKPINKVASNTFGVYLIHCQPIFLLFITSLGFYFDKNLGIDIVLFIILYSVTIYFIATLIDYFRGLLFRICLIDRFEFWISDKLSLLGNSILEYVRIK